MLALLTISLSVTAQAQDSETQGAQDAPLELEYTADTSFTESSLPYEQSSLTGIINGEAATQDEYPMAGAMLIERRYGIYSRRDWVCSSTLIAPDVVLLAAHCLDMDGVEEVEIRWSGQADLSEFTGASDPDWPTDSVPTWDWVIHPDWQEEEVYESGVGDARDLGLLFLDEPLDIPHAYLISEAERHQIDTGNEVEVVGWGLQIAPNAEGASTSEQGQKRYGISHIAELGDYEFQVGAEYSDVRKCFGDSGGPTFMHVDTDREETMRLIGVTSRAYDYSYCASKGGIDARVDVSLDWIEAEMVARCEDGTRAWCDEYGIVSAPLSLDSGSEESGAGEPTGACAYAGGSSGVGWTWVLGLLGLFGIRRR